MKSFGFAFLSTEVFQSGRALPHSEFAVQRGTSGRERRHQRPSKARSRGYNEENAYFKGAHSAPFLSSARKAHFVGISGTRRSVAFAPVAASAGAFGATIGAKSAPLYPRVRVRDATYFAVSFPAAHTRSCGLDLMLCLTPRPLAEASSLSAQVLAPVHPKTSAQRQDRKSKSPLPP